MKRGDAVVSAIFEWAEMFAVAICAVILVLTLLVRHSPVTGHSMYPTLVGAPASSAPDPLAAEPGKQDVLRVSNLLYRPQSGDIVVTQSDYKMDEPLVKRVIAVAGDSVRIDFDSWGVYVNGRMLTEDYVNRLEGSMYSADFYEVVSQCERSEDGGYIIPEGYLFCMGDNRNMSMDSRSEAVGLIDARYVIGKVFFRIYPFDRIGAVK